ncbi:MAG: helix-turn-helix domain-containing protein [Burkholderiales bacterium]|nr:helix-turn-helix domain-containing protein [Burkholderiales bacterium]
MKSDIVVRTIVRNIPVRPRAPGALAALVEPVRIGQCKTTCLTCNLRELCVPCCGLTQSEKQLAERMVFTRTRVRRGENLYRSGDRFTALYGVRYGFFKCVSLLEDGRDQVTGYAIAGDVLGVDGIGPERYACDTVALEDSEVCEIPFSGLMALAQEIPGLQRQFHKMMSREIVREQGVMLQLGTMNAEERLAMLLLDLSKRFAAHGYSPSEFNLRMTREEIGSYLGLKLATVSRTFSRFQDEGLIAVQQKFIRIRDRVRLELVMGRETA